MTWIEELLNNYYLWLRDRTAISVQDSNDWALISTPFLGVFNDNIDIFIKKNHNNLILSDDGETLDRLDLTGINLSRSSARRELAERVLRTYGVKWNRESNELTIDATVTNFPQKKHNFLSAILEIGDLYFFSQENIAHIFREDVAKYFDSNNIIFTPDFITRGKTGLELTFDFQIAFAKKEIVVKAFNSVRRDNLTSFLFSWDDVRPERERATSKAVKAVAVINDKEKSLKPEFQEALLNKDVGVLNWSERENSANLALFSPNGLHI